MSRKVTEGSFWYVKLPNVTVVIVQEVLEVTKCTVLLVEPKRAYSIRNSTRYKTTDIDFIEEVEVIKKKHQTNKTNEGD